MMERANEGHGEHRASCEAGHGAHWGREAVELDPDRIDGDVIAEGRGASRLTERERRHFFFCFLRRNGSDGFFFSFFRVRVRTSILVCTYVQMCTSFFFLSFVDFLFFVLHNLTTELCCAFSFIHTKYEVIYTTVRCCCTTTHTHEGTNHTHHSRQRSAVL